ncbi:hypothetical protein AB0D11_09275 [Streptomyces monashensis]|uniref:hypothetical protein n=1 Tax=Streptomyces monashensis TaxID=1678012 RepID=UPI0033F576F2
MSIASSQHRSPAVRQKEHSSTRPRNWKTLGALAVAGCCATIGLTTGTAEAQTQIKTGNVTQLGSYNDSGRTGNYQFVANNWDSRYQRYQQSLV